MVHDLDDSVNQSFFFSIFLKSISILFILLPFVKYSLLEIVRKISFLLYPIIPESSLKALKIFEIEEKNIKLDTVSNNEYLTKGNNINKIDILFKKIEKNND